MNEAASVKTKQLQWYGTFHPYADSPFGRYRTNINFDPTKPSLNLWLGDDYLVARCMTIEEAQEKAQQHFDGLVMECLE